MGINGITGWGNEGLGWFSLIVALAAVGFAVHSWVEVGDRTFTVIWLLWAVLWSAFFLLMALHRAHLAPAIVVVAVLGLLVLVASVPLSRSLSAPATRPTTRSGAAPGVH